MTDAYTDELFDVSFAERLVFPLSRLVIDVERFVDDDEEPMAAVGMGVIYMKTSDGRDLRHPLSSATRETLLQAYHAHHASLTKLVEKDLHLNGVALIVDCHSFPDTPLPCDQDQRMPRPDFCIGTTPHHTPSTLIEAAKNILEKDGFSVSINKPYTGCIVPLPSYRKKNQRVSSIMLEVNRRLYMDESTGKKRPKFKSAQRYIVRALTFLQNEIK